MQQADICRNQASDTAFNFLKSRIEICHANYEQCRQPQPRFPKRLLEIYYSRGLCLKLIEPPEESSGIYTTLSYCWGSDNKLTTTASKLLDLKLGLKLSRFPAAIADHVS